jgi:hypothetical protein
MRVRQAIGALQFYYERIFHHKIRKIFPNVVTFIAHHQGNLRRRPHSTHREFPQQRPLVNLLQESRSQRIRNLKNRPDHGLCQHIEFRYRSFLICVHPCSSVAILVSFLICVYLCLSVAILLSFLICVYLWPFFPLSLTQLYLRPFMPPRNSREHILRLNPRQLDVYNSPARFRILVAGRRFGKTHLALIEMLHYAQTKGRTIWYVGPSYRQAKRIAWNRLKSLTRPYWSKTPSETDLTIELSFGSHLAIRGADRPDSLRGDGLDFVVLDEFASMRPEAWSEVLRPSLSDRHGRALFISTPKGRNHFYEHFEYAKTDPHWAAFQFTTAQGGIVDAAELNQAAGQLDAECYRQEFEAEFTGAGLNRAYHAFDRAIHVRPLSFEIYHPLVWSIDFNVNPMSMLLMQRLGEIVYVFDEIILPNANTEAACQAFFERTLPFITDNPRTIVVEVYGDASGHQRRTSASATDWTLIRQFFAQTMPHYCHQIRSNSANPIVRDRINCVNSRLRNALGDARLFIDPRCRELIRDLEQVAWATDSTGQVASDLDKSDPARTHSSDALGYFIAQAFPLRPLGGHQSSGRLF